LYTFAAAAATAAAATVVTLSFDHLLLRAAGQCSSRGVYVAGEHHCRKENSQVPGRNTDTFLFSSGLLLFFSYTRSIH
jgi:hypothetical protein